MTLREFLQQEGTDPSLIELITGPVALSIQEIRTVIETGNRGLAGTQNVYGEKQLEIDVQANEVFRKHLKESGLVSSLASEEMESEEVLNPSGKFSVAYDPIDGSSLMDVNFAVGSIVGIYPSGSFVGRKGVDQVASLYAVYGPRTTMILTVKKGTHEFLLGEHGAFFLSKANIRVEESGKYFAPGNLRAAKEREDYRKLIAEWIQAGYTLRYSGGMVPDVNHIFLKGNGIFTYPGYSEAPEGKLRLLFECNPMALLMEQAFGGASSGTSRILEKTIENLHQITPIFIGSKNEVQKVTSFLRS